MAGTAELAIFIRAKDSASKIFDSVNKQAGGLGKTLTSVGKVAAIGMAAGIGVAGAAMLSFAKSAAEEEASIKRLEQAYQNAVGDIEDFGDWMDQAVKNGEALAFADDQVRDSLAMLTAQTSDADEAFRRLEVAEDLARGTGMDLETASRLLGKVTDENVNVLKRYGIAVEEGSTATELLTAVQQKFGGQAAVYAKTAAGAWERFGNQLDNVKETLGAALLPVLTKVGTKLADFLTKHQADIERMTQAAADLVERGFAALGRWFDQHSADIEAALVVMATGLQTAKDAAVGFGGWLLDNREALVAAIVAIGAAFAWANPLSVVAVGMAGLIILVGSLRSELETLPEPLLNIRAKFDEFTIFIFDWADNILAVFDKMSEGIGGRFFPGMNEKVEAARASLFQWRADAERDLAAINSQFEYLDTGIMANQANWEGLAGWMGTEFVNSVRNASTGFYELDGWLGRMQGSFDRVTAAARNFSAAIGSLIAQGIPWSAVMSYQSGGTIPGPIGMPQLAIVHGGERVVPVGGNTTSNRSSYYAPVIFNFPRADSGEAMKQISRQLRGL
ncbi:MAG: hypothetical protein A2Z17_06840 [Gammaproteobacteria bacterium RBG_16_66_13]|nr:MAG: hypothetical protein A2Z17_06840 [Gammaproteobacteria bacterium RBG_16_66_13]